MMLTTVLLAALASGFLGCASIIDGTRQTVTINSEPAGAEVVIDGITRGKTPLTIDLKRKSLFSDSKYAIVRFDGYRDQQVHLDTGLNPWFWGNIITGGLIGSTTDGISGAAFKYSPDAYYVTLSSLSASKADRAFHRKKMWTRNFILANYWHIARELTGGDGEYVSSLYEMLEIHPASKADTRRALRNLLWAHRDVPDYAESVVDSYARRWDRGNATRF